MAEVRPIDANALMELARNHVGRTVDCNDIARFPILDYAPVRHGEWEEVIEKSIFGKRFLRCSNCKSEQGLMIRFNYCPNCGVDMGVRHD